MRPEDLSQQGSITRIVYFLINVVFDEVEEGCEIGVPAFSCVGLGTLIDCVEKRKDLIGCDGSNISAIKMSAKPSTDKFIGPDGIFF